MINRRELLAGAAALVTVPYLPTDTELVEDNTDEITHTMRLHETQVGNGTSVLYTYHTIECKSKLRVDVAKLSALPYRDADGMPPFLSAAWSCPEEPGFRFMAILRPDLDPFSFITL